MTRSRRVRDRGGGDPLERRRLAVDLHARFGGVVPEIAARAHLEAVVPVVDEALAAQARASTRLRPSPSRNAPG